MSKIYIFSALCLVLYLTGCGKSSNITKVTGTVKMKGTGEPLEFIVVEFWPDNGPTSRGKTDASGNFTLRTMDEADAEGAVIGSHRVTFKDTWHMKDDYLNDGGEWVDMSKGKKPRISSKLGDPMSTTITKSVAENQAPFEFELDPIGK
jgi:hypothetical protein